MDKTLKSNGSLNPDLTQDWNQRIFVCVGKC